MKERINRDGANRAAAVDVARAGGAPREAAGQEAGAGGAVLRAAVPAGGHDFGRMRVGTTDLLHRAASEGSAPLEAGLRERFEGRLGADLGNVRIHNGAASAEAAERLGARAYTLGNRIYLGSDVSAMGSVSRSRLLAHEVVHTVQQGGVNVMPHEGLAVSSPQDAAEREAEQIAGAMDGGTAGPMHGAGQGSRSMAMREGLRGGGTIARMVKPHLQRDLKGKQPAVADGAFTLDLKTESHPGAKCGMSGTIKFKASDTSPDSTQIRMLQIARDEDLTTGKEYVWTGGEANRNKVMTAASKDVDPGYFVDLLHAKRSPRTNKTDPDVSPYYIDDYGTGGGNADGSKAGKTVTDASLWDFPGSSGNRRFTFETAAKAADTGYIYATLRWGFTISDASKGKVEKEHASVSLVPSNTFGQAVKNFNEFYKNKGSSTAP